MPTLGLLHWRIEFPPFVGFENAALPSHEELALECGQTHPRRHDRAHQLLLPQLLASKLKPIGTLKPETRDRLHCRKFGFEKSHSRSVQPAPSGWLHEPVWPNTRPDNHWAPSAVV
jgi:hypothetical protein